MQAFLCWLFGHRTPPGVTSHSAIRPHISARLLTYFSSSLAAAPNCTPTTTLSNPILRSTSNTPAPTPVMSMYIRRISGHRFRIAEHRSTIGIKSRPFRTTSLIRHPITRPHRSTIRV